MIQVNEVSQLLDTVQSFDSEHYQNRPKSVHYIEAFTNVSFTVLKI